MSHSDGLMSLGEAIAETSKQRAAQKLFEMSGRNLETVESYAIISLPFDILKDKNQKVSAALYLRQAHQGRHSGLDVPLSIYADERGGRQMTESGAAVDFGAVLITDERLSAQFRFNNNSDLDAQKSKPWIWGHEIALAWKNGDKQAINRHFNEMLKAIEADYKASPNVSARALKIKETLNFLISHQNKSFAERAKLLAARNADVAVPTVQFTLENIKEMIKSKDVYEQQNAFSDLQSSAPSRADRKLNSFFLL